MPFGKATKGEVVRRKITLESAIVLREYEVEEDEPGKVEIVSPWTRVRVPIDREAVQALDAIRSTRTLREASALHRSRGGDLDLVKLAVLLGRKGFLHAVDGVEVEKPELTMDCKIEFFPYEVHREPGRDPMLGCTATRRFVEVDEDTLAALKVIEETRSLREAEAVLLERTGEEYDLMELVTYLAERGFIRAVDGVEATPPVPIATERHRILHSVQPRHVAWLKHPATLVAIGAIVSTWIALAFFDPSIRPGVKRFFWTEDELLVLLTGFGLSILITYGHELAHFFMARAYGIESTVSISHRFYMVVLITDVTNAWRLSKGPRIKIFLAGVLYNITFAAVLGIAAALVQQGMLPGSSQTVSFLLFLQFLNFFPITFQFFLYARTDFYYVIATVLGERNLSADSMAFLKYRIGRLWRTLTGRTPRRACAECPRQVLEDDPFCLHCGSQQPVEDPSKYPFAYRSRHRLAGFGLVMFGGRAWMYMNFFTIGWLMQMRFLQGSIHRLDGAFAAGDWWAVAKAELLLLLVVLQACFISYFFLGDLVKGAWKAMAGLGSRAGLRVRYRLGVGGSA